MKVHRRTETEATLTATEFLEALGLDEGSLAEVSMKWEPDYWRVGAGATIVTVKLTKHRYERRMPRPRKR